jgi:putative transposase
MPRRGALCRALWENAWAEFVPFLQFDAEIRRIVCTTNAIVIWSRPEGVLHVVQETVNPGDPRGGCGYLPPSMTQILRRNSAGSTCAPTRLAA